MPVAFYELIKGSVAYFLDLIHRNLDTKYHKSLGLRYRWVKIKARRIRRKKSNGKEKNTTGSGQIGWNEWRTEGVLMWKSKTMYWEKQEQKRIEGGGGAKGESAKDEKRLRTRGRMYQCQRAVGGLLEALWSQTTDPLACAERKQRVEDTSRQIISSHAPGFLLELGQLGYPTKEQSR